MTFGLWLSRTWARYVLRHPRGQILRWGVCPRCGGTTFEEFALGTCSLTEVGGRGGSLRLPTVKAICTTCGMALTSIDRQPWRHIGDESTLIEILRSKFGQRWLADITKKDPARWANQPPSR